MIPLYYPYITRLNNIVQQEGQKYQKRTQKSNSGEWKRCFVNVIEPNYDILYKPSHIKTYGELAE